MKKKVVVISLGGSLIAPEHIDAVFLDKFKKTLKKYSKTRKFVIVCGGGTVARNYMQALAKEKVPEIELSLAGMRATRANAVFMMQFFGKEANASLPLDMRHVKNELLKNNIVICGALRFVPKTTSDSTAARLARYLKSPFINMTNVKGLYTANPHTHKNAKFIPSISWKDFEKKARKMHYKNGQHFVLDQHAATLIRKHKIPTYIIGKGLNNLKNIISNKKFIGTTISG